MLTVKHSGGSIGLWGVFSDKHLGTNKWISCICYLLGNSVCGRIFMFGERKMGSTACPKHGPCIPKQHVQ